MDTKEKILTVSLELFALKGFSETSIRDICKKVPIKESTIYYHFKNKQDILDTLSDRFVSMTKHLYISIQNRASLKSSLTKDEFVEGSLDYLKRYLLDGFINSYIRIINIELADNKKLYDMYKQEILEHPIKHQAMIFKRLIEINFIKNKDIDCDSLAIIFFSPILYYFQKYLINGKLTAIVKKQAISDVTKHLHFFVQQYCNV